MIELTSKIIILEKLCAVDRKQMEWFRLLTSSSSSKVAITSTQSMSIPSRHPWLGFLTVLKIWNSLRKKWHKLGEVAILKITSISFMLHSNSFPFILSNVKWLDISNMTTLLCRLDFVNFTSNGVAITRHWSLKLCTPPSSSDIKLSMPIFINVTKYFIKEGSQNICTSVMLHIKCS